MIFKIPVTKKNSVDQYQFFDNSNRVNRILYRFYSYKKISTRALRKGVSVLNLIRAQFPFLLSDASFPPIVSIEFTNVCNLKCPYCTSPLGLRKRGYMDRTLLEKIVEELKLAPSNRIQIVGNGEPTLHPEFEFFLAKLVSTNRLISMVSNGQWTNDIVAETIIKSGIDVVEISIDAGGKAKYESSRINGSYEKLIYNLKKLNNAKKLFNSKIIINIRLMVRPSEKNNYLKEMLLWRHYADAVMPQFLNKINNTNYSDDLFIPVQKQHNIFPKCSLPFKHMEIKYSGEILMCYYSFFQLGAPGLVIGNINLSSIKALWNSDLMNQYRTAHRKRIEDKMSICKGCPCT